MRLIDADALMRCIPNEDITSRFAVENAPTIEANPVKRGKWIKKDNWYFCSECGEEMFFTGTYDKSQHYCYNCGACMVKQGDITTE